MRRGCCRDRPLPGLSQELVEGEYRMVGRY